MKCIFILRLRLLEIYMRSKVSSLVQGQRDTITDFDTFCKYVNFRFYKNFVTCTNAQPLKYNSDGLRYFHDT
eukprot:UN09065